MDGQTFLHYRVLDKIGAGGMGEVYRAHDEQLDRDVAIKVVAATIANDPAAGSRLLREARAAAALNHPHICTIHEVGEVGGRAFIAMELVDGQSLDQIIPIGGAPIEQVVRYGQQIADALAHAHDRGVVHRDLKAANVLVTREGRVKVLDFGLAKRLPPAALAEATTVAATLTEAGAFVGTLPYMAPEQFRGGPADARTDVWALGVVLYEMATGARPFAGRTGFEVSSAVLSRPPAPLPRHVPVELQGIIAKCLEKQPERRYQRASEVHAALEAIQTGSGVPRPWHARVVSRQWTRRGLAAASIVLALILLVVLGRGLWQAVRGPHLSSIAVLPLKNLSGDPQQEYFSDGLTEALITDLARIRALRVSSRTSAMRYKATDKSLPEIARELNVEAILEAAALRMGDRVRITAQLFDAKTEQNLWAESYERDLRDILSLQGEVARAIAQAIQVAVTPEETRRLASARPVNPEAYEAYLKGEVYLWKLTPAAVDTALEYFQLALQKDQSYAPAHLAIGMLWAARSNIGDLPPHEGWPKAKSAALRILALDDTSVEAHTLLAVVLMQYDWDWPAAEREFRRAIEINPNYADVHRFYSIFLASTGRREQGMAEIRRCVELDPQTPLYQLAYGIAQFNLGRYDDAIAGWQKLLRTDPDFSLTHGWLWSAFYKKGMYEEAMAEARKAYAGRGDDDVADSLARGYAEGGYQRAMYLAAETLAARFKLRYVHPTAVAKLYAHAGERDRTLEWLEKAYQERDSQLIFLPTAWDNVRDDPRFQDLLRRMKFPN